MWPALYKGATVSIHALDELFHFLILQRAPLFGSVDLTQTDPLGRGSCVPAFHCGTVVCGAIAKSGAKYCPSANPKILAIVIDGFSGLVWNVIEAPSVSVESPASSVLLVTKKPTLPFTTPALTPCIA